MAFAELPENGVTLPTIQGAHTLDLAIATLGRYADLNALTSTQYPEVEIGDPAKREHRSIPDHMLIQARLQTDAPLTIEVAGGRHDEDVTFRFEVVGENGTLALEGGALRGFQSGRLALRFNGEPQAVKEGELASLPDEAVNVAGLYAALRDDITNSTEIAPGCEHAVRLMQLLDDVAASSADGGRKQSSEWPKG